MKTIIMASVASFLISAVVQAQDFRIETAVFVEKEKKPFIESLTVFSADKVYDFLRTDPEETIVMDLNRGRFLLLDIDRKVKTEILMDDVGRFNMQLREQASTERDVELFNPSFSYQHEEEGDWHLLTSERLNYRAKGTAVRFKEAAERYREFADWSAQLNALRPGHLPPFARMQLNKLLAEKGLIPKEVEREIASSLKKAKMRSVHSVYWALNTGDQQRIHQADDQIATFNPISPDQYFDMNRVAQKR